MALLRGFVRVIDGINEYFGRAVALLILVLVGLVMMEMVLRYVFASPTIWATEFITFLFAAIIMLGGGCTPRHRDHVNVDILYNRFSERGRAVADCLTAGFSLLSMLSRGYDRRLSVGCIAAGGALGVLIPPSVLMIVLGLYANVSIGALFLGGIPAGGLLMALFIGWITVASMINPPSPRRAEGRPRAMGREAHRAQGRDPADRAHRARHRQHHLGRGDADGGRRRGRLRVDAVRRPSGSTCSSCAPSPRPL